MWQFGEDNIRQLHGLVGIDVKGHREGDLGECLGHDLRCEHILHSVVPPRYPYLREFNVFSLEAIGLRMEHDWDHKRVGIGSDGEKVVKVNPSRFLDGSRWIG